MYKNKVISLGVFCASALFLLCGCSSVNEILDGATEDNKTASSNGTVEQEINSVSTATPPRVSPAMATLKPLAQVAGTDAQTNLNTSVPGNSEKFHTAIEYAQSTDTHALLVWQGGQLRLEQYFNGFDGTARLESASMHKSVVGLLVGAALSDGTIKDAEVPIKKYISEWQHDPRGDIKLIDLLTMTSGLESFSFVGGPNSPGMQYVFEGDSARERTLTLELKNEPGSVFRYSNSVTQLLVIILERATETPYTEYLSERIWKQIGASDAYVWLNEPTGFPRGYTALLATALDWLKLGILTKDLGQYKEKQIISSDIVQRATTSSLRNINYGWHMWLGADYNPRRYYNEEETGIAVMASAPYLTDDLIFFDGFGGQRVYISRKKDLIIVRLGEVRFDWDDAMLPNLVLEALNE